MGIPGWQADAALLFGVVSAALALRMWADRRSRRRTASSAPSGARFRFESLVEHSSDLIAVLDADGRVVYVSPSITHLLGQSADAFLGQRWDVGGDALGPTTLENTADFDQLLTLPGRSATFEYTVVDRNGDEHRFEAVATNLLDEPTMRGVVLNSRDVTDRVRLEHDLRDREESFRMLFDDNPHPMWVFDNQTLRFLRVNDAACQQYGYTREEFTDDMTILDLRRDEDRAELLDLIVRRDVTATRPAAMWRHQTHSGDLLNVDVRTHQTTFDGHEGTLVLAQDVTERCRLEAALEHRAFHDPLTELPNRALFRDRVQHALDAAPGTNAEVCVLLLDLDGFKTVNDTLGHAAGDELLDLAAHRLESCVRSGDTIARMGGDEFAVLLENPRAGQPAALADRLLATLREPFTVHNQEVFLTGSIGISESSPQSDAPATRTQLLRDADLAMYVAKDAGRDRYAVFEPRMGTRMAQRLTLKTDLQHAMTRDQLCIRYQPTVRLDTLEIVGFEALLRWNHPGRGLVLPAEFVPLAEETGLIVPIGRWVLREACRQLAFWRDTFDGYEHLGIAINVSGRQLQGPPFVNDVRDAVERAGLSPSAVSLEITESLLLTDTDAISDQLHALKKYGVHLAIDDFGTGYSALSYLTRFPLDVMKLDKSFLAGIEHSADRQALLRSIIDMGHSLHLSTLGEGIETPAELDRLRACGCDFGQGFLFDRPLTPDQAGRRLARVAELVPIASR